MLSRHPREELEKPEELELRASGKVTKGREFVIANISKNKGQRYKLLASPKTLSKKEAFHSSKELSRVLWNQPRPLQVFLKTIVDTISSSPV